MHIERPADTRPRGLAWSPAARQLLADAQAEAHRLAHAYVGTEHLVLALATQASTQATTVPALARVGVDWMRLRAHLAATLRPGASLPTLPADRPYTSSTKRVFALAAERARRRGHRQLGVEHLLVGIVLEGQNIGAQVLEEHGLG